VGVDEVLVGLDRGRAAGAHAADHGGEGQAAGLQPLDLVLELVGLVDVARERVGALLRRGAPLGRAEAVGAVLLVRGILRRVLRRILRRVLRGILRGGLRGSGRGRVCRGFGGGLFGGRLGLCGSFGGRLLAFGLLWRLLFVVESCACRCVDE
jgi:hypothetical protein